MEHRKGTCCHFLATNMGEHEELTPNGGYYRGISPKTLSWFQSALLGFDLQISRRTQVA